MISISSFTPPTSSPSAPPIPLDPNNPTPDECKALRPPLSSLPRGKTLGVVIGISSPSDPDPLMLECCAPSQIQTLPPCWIWCELPTDGPLVPEPKEGLDVGRGGVYINGKSITGKFTNCLANGGTNVTERGLSFRVGTINVGGSGSVSISGASPRLWSSSPIRRKGKGGLSGPPMAVFAVVVLVWAGLMI